LPEALNAAQRAVALAPHEKTPRAFLAEVLHRSGRYEEAERALRIAKGLPDNPFSWHDPVAAEVLNMRRDTAWKLRQAEELISAGRYRDAVADLSDLARRETQLAEPSARLGQLLTELRDYENAKRILLDAGKRFPDSSEIEFRLGVLYVFTDRLPEAIDAFKAALERNPTHFLSQYNLGQALRMNGDDDAAQDAFRRAVKLDPASIPAHLALAKLLLELEDHGGAIGSLQAVLHLDSENEEARKLLDKIPPSGQPC